MSVKAIRGTWNSGMPDTLQIFDEAIKSRMFSEENARDTLTSTMAERYGFTGVRIEEIKCSSGDHTDIKVVFTT